MFDYRIKTFLKLYDELNYRRTAEKLNMTQPGVTQHIKHLENEYSVKLFTYDGKVLSRTKEAVVLKHHIDRMLSEERNMRKEFEGPDIFNLKIGATKTIGEFVISSLVESFVKEENNRLSLIVDNTRTLLELLEKGEIDFAIIEGSFDKKHYDHHLMKKENFVGICSEKHPFAGKEVCIEDVLNETLIIREKGSGTRGILEQYLKEDGYALENVKRVMEISSFSMIQHIISKNLGISFAYMPIADGPGLSYFHIKDKIIQREFNFVYLNKDVAMDKIRRFCKK